MLCVLLCNKHMQKSEPSLQYNAQLVKLIIKQHYMCNVKQLTTKYNHVLNKRKCTVDKHKPILIVIVDCITWNSTKLFAVAAENLW